MRLNILWNHATYPWEGQDCSSGLYNIFLAYIHFEQSCCVWYFSNERPESSSPKTAYAPLFSCSSEMTADGDNAVCSHSLRPHIDTYASMRILDGKKAKNWIWHGLPANAYPCTCFPLCQICLGTYIDPIWNLNTRAVTCTSNGCQASVYCPN